MLLALALKLQENVYLWASLITKLKGEDLWFSNVMSIRSKKEETVFSISSFLLATRQLDASCCCNLAAKKIKVLAVQVNDLSRNPSPVRALKFSAKPLCLTK